jgi:hypothetical protein
MSRNAASVEERRSVPLDDISSRTMTPASRATSTQCLALMLSSGMTRVSGPGGPGSRPSTVRPSVSGITRPLGAPEKLIKTPANGRSRGSGAPAGGADSAAANGSEAAAAPITVRRGRGVPDGVSARANGSAGLGAGTGAVAAGGPSIRVLRPEGR